MKRQKCKEGVLNWCLGEMKQNILYRRKRKQKKTNVNKQYIILIYQIQKSIKVNKTEKNTCKIDQR